MLATKHEGSSGTSAESEMGFHGGDASGDSGLRRHGDGPKESQGGTHAGVVLLALERSGLLSLRPGKGVGDGPVMARRYLTLVELDIYR